MSSSYSESEDSESNSDADMVSSTTGEVGEVNVDDEDLIEVESESQRDVDEDSHKEFDVSSTTQDDSEVEYIEEVPAEDHDNVAQMNDAGKDSDMESESDEEDTRTSIRQELSNLTFEELLALKSKIGTKEYNEAMFGPQKGSNHSSSSKKEKKEFHRGNKNRPRELSSKAHVSNLRQIIPVPKTVKDHSSKTDPRFDDQFGKLNERLWSANYGFIRDMAKEEQKNFKQTFGQDKSISEEKKLKMRTYLQRLTNKEKSAAQNEVAETKRHAEKKQRREQTKDGRRPYYMKKSTRKYVELAEKYDQLKAQGKLESYLKKKRVKNAARDKKLLRN